MSKRFIIILLVCVLGMFGVYAATSKKDEGGSNGGGDTSKLSNHVYGENKKKVTLVEYGDFVCPACASFYPIVQQVKEKYKDDIQFQFRHFPLSQIHQNARTASRAAEAASNQGKFWEMHDILYEQQDSWKSSGSITSLFEGYATQIGLKPDQYKKDFASSAVNEVINADYAEGTKQGVSSTPTFFLQGKKLDKNPTTLEEFSKLIDEAIKNAGQ